MTRRFDVCRNIDTARRREVPYLIVLQSEMLEDLATVVVAPVMRETNRSSITKLTPQITVGGSPYRVSIPDLAGVPRARLGPAVENASEYRDQFTRAIDFLFTGF